MQVGRVPRAQWHRKSLCGSSRRPTAPPPRALQAETPEQARARRLRESAQVEERVVDVTTLDQWRAVTADADAQGHLVVVEAQSDLVCMTGLDEEPELHWKADQDAALQPCRSIKHAFQRTARESKDVVFVSVHTDDDAAQELCDELNIEIVPTLQFWRSGKMLWEQKGAIGMEQDIGEGVLFFNGSAANGLQAADHVTDIRSEHDLATFVASQPPEVLTVIMVATADAKPCIGVYPAVVALARSFKGYAAFARLIADDTPQGQRMLGRYNVVEVPTFIFYKGASEVDRHVGSSRADLIGRIMEVQSRFGVAPPPPPPGAGMQRRKVERRVTRKARS